MNGKKWIALLLALVMSVSLFACGTKPAADGDDSQNNDVVEDTTRVFTDSCGREVTVPANVEKVAISGPLAQIVVFALAPDKLVGIANAWDESAAQFLDTKYYDLPLLGQFYGGKGEMNLETLLAAAPDVVIDVGEPKGSIVEDMDALQEQTGIPFVHIDAYLASMDNTYAMLGDLLAMPNEAQGLADSKGTGNEVDMEQILNWNPDVILFAPGSIYDTVAENENWQTITAIKNGAYYEVPMGPYNWMGFPPSVQRLLGMMWMTTVLYPNAADYDLYTEVSSYFQLFYHCELTQAQYDALVANSLPAADAAA